MSTRLPASNIWNTDISKLPVNSHSAAWLKSMDAAATFLHPEFGPNPGGFPFGMPLNIVTSAHPLVKIHFQFASESDKGPYPLGPGTQLKKIPARDFQAVNESCLMVHRDSGRLRRGAGAAR